jgi:hypothetical protein
MTAETPPIPLQAPGAGLPWYQAMMGRYVLLPWTSFTHSWRRASLRFVREGKEILRLAGALPVERADMRVLVKGVLGIEDSSRYWSVAMTLEHLIIVGDKMAEIIVALSHEREPSERVDIAAVKPPGGLPAGEAIPAFEDFLQRYERRTSVSIGSPRARRRLIHPWFGPITAHRWHCLAAMHQGIHRRQVAAIVAGLGGS